MLIRENKKVGLADMVKYVRELERDAKRNDVKINEPLEKFVAYEISKDLIKGLRFTDIESKEALATAYSLFVASSKDNYTLNDLIEIIEPVEKELMEA